MDRRNQPGRGRCRIQQLGQFQEGIVSHRNGAGAWTSYPADSTNNMPDGYPISMEMCGGVLNIAMYNNNGGIARIDLANATVLSISTEVSWTVPVQRP